MIKGTPIASVEPSKRHWRILGVVLSVLGLALVCVVVFAGHGKEVVPDGMEEVGTPYGSRNMMLGENGHGQQQLPYGRNGGGQQQLPYGGNGGGIQQNQMKPMGNPVAFRQMGRGGGGGGGGGGGCHCFANGQQNESFCETGARRNSKQQCLSARAKCHWGPQERPACNGQQGRTLGRAVYYA